MDRPIGLFDSGFGGLTVMREVVRLLPYENLIYLGDTAHLPYGNKSPETILQYAIENASFLTSKNIKLLIIACHTASSHALKALQEILPIPVLGMIEPGIQLLKGIERLAILGTTSTIESGIYQSLLLKQNPQAKIYSQACPLFVPLIEEGLYEHEVAKLIAKIYLDPIKDKIDAALLACTHYPLIRPILQTLLGPKVALIEPAHLCAQQAHNLLQELHLLNVEAKKPVYEFYATDAPDKFKRFGNLFLGALIEKVEKKQDCMKVS